MYIALLLCHVLVCRPSAGYQPPSVSRTAIPPFCRVTLLLYRPSAVYHSSAVSRTADHHSLVTGCSITLLLYLVLFYHLSLHFEPPSHVLMLHKLLCPVYFVCRDTLCFVFLIYVSLLRAWSRRKHSTTFSTSFSLLEVTSQEPETRNL